MVSTFSYLFYPLLNRSNGHHTDEYWMWLVNTPPRQAFAQALKLLPPRRWCGRDLEVEVCCHESCALRGKQNRSLCFNWFATICAWLYWTLNDVGGTDIQPAPVGGAITSWCGEPRPLREKMSVADPPSHFADNYQTYIGPQPVCLTCSWTAWLNVCD